MEFIDIQRDLVDTLLKIPAMETPSGRTSLLDGLPDPGLRCTVPAGSLRRAS